METTVRAETPADEAAVREVNRQAFAGPVEAQIVDALRGSPDSISLVAIVDQQVVGHVLFTPVTLDPAAAVRIAGLAPMAVRPDFQQKGVGSALVRAGFNECRRLHYHAIVVVGHPEYYPRFGFQPADRWGMQYAESVPREVFMAVELQPGALENASGIVRFRPEFAEP